MKATAPVWQEGFPALSELDSAVLLAVSTDRSEMRGMRTVERITEWILAGYTELEANQNKVKKSLAELQALGLVESFVSHVEKGKSGRPPDVFRMAAGSDVVRYEVARAILWLDGHHPETFTRDEYLGAFPAIESRIPELIDLGYLHFSGSRYSAGWRCELERHYLTFLGERNIPKKSVTPQEQTDEVSSGLGC